MQVENRKLTDLKLDPNNARKHDERNIGAIKASLAQFGQRKPIVISADGIILAGNGTFVAAQELGWPTLAVAVAPAEWDSATAKAYALADNRSADLAEWDSRILLDTLNDLPVDLLPATGFDATYIEAMNNVFGDAPDLDDLFDEHGEPTEEDGMTRVAFMVPVDVAARWEQAVKNAGSGSPLENTCTAIQAAYDAIVGDE